MYGSGCVSLQHRRKPPPNEPTRIPSSRKKLEQVSTHTRSPVPASVTSVTENSFNPRCPLARSQRRPSASTSAADCGAMITPSGPDSRTLMTTFASARSDTNVMIFAPRREPAAMTISRGILVGSLNRITVNIPARTAAHASSRLSISVTSTRMPSFLLCLRFEANNPEALLSYECTRMSASALFGMAPLPANATHWMPASVPIAGVFIGNHRLYSMLGSGPDNFRDVVALAVPYVYPRRRHGTLRA